MNNVSKRPRGAAAHRTPEDRLAIRLCALMYEPFMSGEQVAQEFGVTRQAVSEMLVPFRGTKAEISLYEGEMRARLLALYASEAKLTSPAPQIVFWRAAKRAFEVRNRFLKDLLAKEKALAKVA